MSKFKKIYTMNVASLGTRIAVISMLVIHDSFYELN